MLLVYTIISPKLHGIWNIQITQLKNDIELSATEYFERIDSMANCCHSWTCVRFALVAGGRTPSRCTHTRFLVASAHSLIELASFSEWKGNIRLLHSYRLLRSLVICVNFTRSKYYVAEKCCSNTHGNSRAASYVAQQFFLWEISEWIRGALVGRIFAAIPVQLKLSRFLTR